jgi:ketosteroid isomerase-like protein
VLSMRHRLFSVLLVLFSACCGANATTPSAAPPVEARQQINEFNRRFVDACRRMDHKADVEFWADDGVDLLPGLEPMVGKATIARWLAGLEHQLRGAKMLDCTVDWREIRIEGDMAYEWGMNSQRVALPNRPKPFSSNGKILLILKRQKDGAWRVELESWNANPRRKAGQ